MTRTSKLAALTLATLAAALVASTAMAERGPDANHGGRMGAFAAFDFAAIDADKDGKITPAEIEAHRTAEITAADTDGDGFLNAEELAALQVKQMSARGGQMAERMLTRLDSDKDGKLSLAEMQARRPADRMFDRLDADNDGALSEAEIAAAKDRMAERRGGKDRRGGGHHNGHDNN